ncbi:TonB-dependent receptor plug domain-containing protein [Aquimarina gracilis]|uniref:TonB-dependent receptor plug domain-containing protein n=1 Tax=Aquimarina gracilis TaxID=874422 RepID=A0ABU5ZTX7_9FLAO|nr:TonB-dependent receptor plug domain-containing protein [Aquimarina gracilis]MEB3344842.1 TonB-dependent receptor plug domain-containing protein [Aquimarina gracilis]
MIKTTITVFFTFLFFIVQQTFAQSEQEPLPLKIILTQIEEKFDCSFTYIDEDIEEVRLLGPSDDLDLKGTIKHLQDNTSIDFTILNNKNIVLSARLREIEICGILQSLTEDKTLSNATIRVKNNTTISDETGKFVLTVRDIDEWIKINFIGYKALRLPIKDFIDQPCKTILLTPEVQYLNEVILNDFLVKGINKKSDGSIIIDYNDFGILPGLIEPDLLQTIQALPGVLSVEETVSDINVRGGTNDQNLILWDGIKMYQSGHFFGLISAFNPYLTKNVQLIKNGSSAAYGDGVSSVIAMNTANEINKEFDASIGINMISLDGYLDAPLGKKSSLQVSSRKSISEVLETPTYNQFFDKAFQDSEVTNTIEDVSNTDQEFSFYDTSLRWLYQLTPKDLLKVNAILMRNDLVFEENALINQVNVSRESSAKQNNFAGSISYQRNWNSFFRSEILIYGTNYNLETINSDIINDQRLLQENEVLETGVKVNTLLKLNNFFNLKSGYQFNETGISNLRDVNNPTFRDFTKEVIRTNSIFSEAEFKSQSNNTHVNLGFRLNHFNKFYTYLFEPRISINHRFNNHFTIEALGELKSQVTSQIIESQNDFLGIENRKWVLSNENDIPIIESQQISFGISYNHNNWLVSTDTYYKNVDGIITQSQGFQNQLEFERDHGSYTIKGIDFLINKRFKSFGAWLSYSYAENNYTFNNLSERDFPNNIDIRHNLNLAFSYSKNNFKFSTGINWHSGKPTTRPIAGNEISDNLTINYLPPNSDTLEDYFRWDASATYDFKFANKTSGMAGISLWNVLGQKNTVNNYYRIDSNITTEEVKQLGLGFTPNIVFRINF